MSTKSPSLFDDDAEFVATRTALARRANPLGASKKAKSVNRLLQQVESLRQRFEKEKRRLDEALIFHAGHLRHRYDRVAALRADGVRGLARFLDDPRIGKADRRNLREFLKEQLQGVLTHVQVPDQEITDLFERLHGVSYEEAAASDMELMRSEMGAMFESLGLDLEMPEMRPDMSEEEIALRRLSGAVRASSAPGPSGSRPRSAEPNPRESFASPAGTVRLRAGSCGSGS